MFILKDGIDDAGWLNPAEKALLRDQLEAEGRGKETRAAGRALSPSQDLARDLGLLLLLRRLVRRQLLASHHHPGSRGD